MKHFTTVGVCIPSKHYMVDLTSRVKTIMAMVDEGKYFTQLSHNEKHEKERNRLKK